MIGPPWRGTGKHRSNTAKLHCLNILHPVTFKEYFGMTENCTSIHKALRKYGPECYFDYISFMSNHPYYKQLNWKNWKDLLHMTIQKGILQKKSIMNEKWKIYWTDFQICWWSYQTKQPIFTDIKVLLMIIPQHGKKIPNISKKGSSSHILHALQIDNTD